MNRSAYPKYKSSGVKWLGDIPEHWHVVRLKHNSYMKGRIGWQNLRADEFTDEGPYLVTGMHFRAGIVDWDSCYHITEDRYLRAPEIFLNPGDVLITKDGSIGKVAYINNLPGPASLNSHLLLIRPWKAGNYNPRYLYYVLASEIFQRYAMMECTGTTFNGISQATVANYQMTIPKLKEQREIVIFLDRETTRIDTLIEKKQRQIELLQEKRSAIISHAVTKGLDPNVKMKDSGIGWLGEIPSHWQVKAIRRVAMTVKTGGTPSGAEEMYFNENGFNWYTPGDFHEDVFLDESSRKLSEIGKKEVRVFPAMTVMMIGIGATIGKVAILREPSSCNQQINAIICNSEMTPKYLTYFLRIMRKYIYRCGKFTTLPIINQEDTKALLITCPPLPEQAYIVSLLDQEEERTNDLISKIQMSIDKLREYRSALISAAVTGKIDVRNKVS